MASLNGVLSEPRVIIAPGVFDMVSLKLADQGGFELLYMTGFGVAASHFGRAGRRPCDLQRYGWPGRGYGGAAKTSLIADGDTGFAG